MRASVELRRQTVFRLLAMGALCSAVVACRGSSSSASDSAAVGPAVDSADAAFRAQLGRTWELARLGEQDMPPSIARPREPGRHPGPGSRPTIRFSADSAGALTDAVGGANAGGWSFCNGYGTAYRVGPGDRLRFQGFQSTLVGCNGPDSLETRYFRALANTRRFELSSDTLRLIGEDGSGLTFVPATGPGDSEPGGGADAGGAPPG